MVHQILVRLVFQVNKIIKIKNGLVHFDTFSLSCSSLAQNENEDWVTCNISGENCTRFDCALTTEADLETLKKYDLSLYREYKNHPLDTIKWALHHSEVIDE